MTFLNPAALWGLFAAAIPILIHLISLGNTREIEFSSVRFLQELKHKTIRKLQIRQWLLILLRTAAIIFLILMFSRPVQRGFYSGLAAGEQESNVVIFVDNSASMGVKSGQLSFLDQAKQTISTITSSFNGLTYLRLFQTCPPQELFSGQLTSVEQLKEPLAKVQQTQSYDNLWEVVDSVLKTIPVSEPNRESFILSDFQSLPSRALRRDIVDTLKTWRFYCLGVDAVDDNLSIVDVKAVSQIRLPNHLLKLNARVSNNGVMEKRNVPVELYVNDERVGQIVSHFQPGRVKDFLFQVYPGKSGIIQGYLQIPKDDYSFDNKWTFELSIPDQISCLVLGQSQDEIFLLKTALESISGQSGFLNIQTKITPEIHQLDLDNTDVLVLHDPALLYPAAVEDLKKFLARRGGVIWFAGDRGVDFLRSDVERNLKLPEIQGFNSVEAGSFFSVEPGKKLHPILRDLNLRNMEKELPHIFKYNQVRLKKGQYSILQLNNQDPLLIDIPVRGGRIFYFTIPLDLAWSDLPIKGLSIPLLHRLMILLATDENNTSSVLVDEIKTIQLKSELINKEWSVQMPGGLNVLKIPDYTTESLKIQETNRLGSYSVFAQDQMYTQFSTHLSPEEQLGNRIDPEKLLSYLGKDRTMWIKADENLKANLENIRHGKSLWRLFLVLAIAMLIIESAVGRTKVDSMRKNK
ncbi:MAG: BatA domain-containing protein [Fidelibacterota bacterium]